MGDDTCLPVKGYSLRHVKILHYIALHYSLVTAPMSTRYCAQGPLNS